MIVSEYRLSTPAPLVEADLIKLTANLPSAPGVIAFYSVTGFEALKVVAWSGQGALSLDRGFLLESKKAVFFSLGAGLWVNTSFTYAEGVTEMAFNTTTAAPTTPTHRIAGTCKRHGVPFAGAVQVVSVFEQAHLGSATANPSTGDWVVDIALSGEVFVFVSMPYGAEFTPGADVAPGDTIHPPSPSGFVYEVTQAGTLGDMPATWPTSTPLTTGTAKLAPVAFLAPEIHGPIKPALIT